MRPRRPLPRTPAQLTVAMDRTTRSRAHSTTTASRTAASSWCPRGRCPPRTMIGRPSRDLPPWRVRAAPEGRVCEVGRNEVDEELEGEVSEVDEGGVPRGVRERAQPRQAGEPTGSRAEVEAPTEASAAEVGESEAEEASADEDAEDETTEDHLGTTDRPTCPHLCRRRLRCPRDSTTSPSRARTCTRPISRRCCRRRGTTCTRTLNLHLNRPSRWVLTRGPCRQCRTGSPRRRACFPVKRHPRSTPTTATSTRPTSPSLSSRWVESTCRTRSSNRPNSSSTSPRSLRLRLRRTVPSHRGRSPSAPRTLRRPQVAPSSSGIIRISPSRLTITRLPSSTRRV